MYYNQPPCTLIVVLEHNPLAFIYGMLTPTLEINGYKEKRSWGAHTIHVAPGRYLISASYPWFLNEECGKNSVDFVIHPGETRIIRYRTPIIRYVQGSMSVQ